MAYSSVRATLGGRDVKKTTKQTKKPSYSTVSASTGAKSYRGTGLPAMTGSYPPERTSRTARKMPERETIPKRLVKQMEEHRREGERLAQELKTRVLKQRIERPKKAIARPILRESARAYKGTAVRERKHPTKPYFKSE